MPFWQPISFFFFRSQRIFFFKISLHIFFQTCRYYHLFIMYILVLQHRWRSQEKTGRAFLNNNEQSEIPRRFFSLVCFYFWISKCHDGSRGERDYFLAVGEQRREVYTYFTHKACFFFLRLYYHHHLLGEKVIYNGTLYLLLSF